MKNDKNNIKVIELMPYGSFPVGVSHNAADFTMSAFLSSWREETNSEKAKYWFENEEFEVA